MSSQKLEDVPKIHYYFHDTMTEICCFRAYLDIFFLHRREIQTERS